MVDVNGAPSLVEEGLFDDIGRHGMLHVKMLWSPHAHARIVRIDSRRAEALHGVHCVLTCDNTPPLPLGGLGRATFHRTLRFVGDRVAAVAADSPETAEEALALITVEYDVLPALLDAEKAMLPGAPRVHDGPHATGACDPGRNPLTTSEPTPTGACDPGRNLLAHVVTQVGDVEEGLARADVVVEEIYRLPCVQQAPLHPHRALAWTDGYGHVHIRTRTRSPHWTAQAVAQAVGLPVEDIQVESTTAGCAHDTLIEDIPALVAVRTGRPALLSYSRREEFVSSHTQHAQVIRMRVGATREGILTALDMHVLANAGAYGTRTRCVEEAQLQESLSLYRCPHARFEAHVVYTHLPVAEMSGGQGDPQGTFAVECAMDELAHRLEMDPLAVRQLNVVQPGDFLPLVVRPMQSAASGGQGPVPVVVTSSLPQCIEQGAHCIGWWGRAHGGRRVRSGAGSHLRRGIGMACLLHGTAEPMEARDASPLFAAQFAEVEVDTETGSVHLLRFVSAVDCGQAGPAQACEMQIDSGAIQGMGQALSEELRFDEEGRALNPSFRDYRIFSALDMPDMQSVTVSAPPAENDVRSLPTGAGALGDLAVHGPSPAIANAVFDATGVRVRTLPLTPERVWRALKDAREPAPSPPR